MADRPTTVRYQVLTWLTLAAAVSYLCRNAVSVAESTVRSELGLTLAQSGWFMAHFSGPTPSFRFRADGLPNVSGRESH